MHGNMSARLIFVAFMLLLQHGVAEWWRPDSNPSYYGQRHDSSYDKGSSWTRPSRYRSYGEERGGLSGTWMLLLPVGLLAAGGLLISVLLLGIAAWSATAREHTCKQIGSQAEQGRARGNLK